MRILGQARIMSANTVSIRKARPADAETIARIYIDAWRDTYPGMLPARLLLSMSQDGQTTRWRNAIAMAAHEAVYVAETSKGRVVALSSLGRARDSALGFDAEIYTLYVDPMMTGLGIGRGMLAGAFAALSERGHASCVIWSHAKNPARFFYEAMGGKPVAERTMTMMGMPVPEVGYGWRTLTLAETRRTQKSST